MQKITRSFNFWLNFALNSKDNSFVEILLNKVTKADYCKKSLKQILEGIAKFLYGHFRSEEVFNKIMKQNHNKLYELILKFKKFLLILKKKKIKMKEKKTIIKIIKIQKII